DAWKLHWKFRPAPTEPYKNGPIPYFDSLLGSGEEIHVGQIPGHSAAKNTSGNPTLPVFVEPPPPTRLASLKGHLRTAPV
ncbi:hypothetical protein MTO96_036714, partial [Rhipicephalus appendiculatus]